MVLILKNKSSESLRQQLDDALKKKKTKKSRHGWKKFFGKINWQINPVYFQRGLRDE